MLCDKNNSPDFLTKILYNSEFVDKTREEDAESCATDSSEDSLNSPKENSSSDDNNLGKRLKNTTKKKNKKKTSLDLDDEATSNLDYSTEEELEDFDASSVADDLLKAINEG